MNKKFTYKLIIGFFLLAIILVVVRFKSKEQTSATSFYELQDRKGSLALAPEWATTRSVVSNLFQRVRTNPKDDKAYLGLAAAFISEARVTGNYSYYDRAAMKQVNSVLEQDPNNFQALTYKALIYLSQHHFSDGLAIAAQAQKINPYNAFIYGILIDANVEMGTYKEAVNNAEKMMSIRPDLRSYSRVSYLREIHGDYAGAIEAMKLAVEAGAPGDESTEWTRIQLGHLYENTGDLKNAALQYNIALSERKDYPHAIAGLGNIAMANKDYKTAIQYYNQADTLLKDYGIKESLIDAYQLTGETKKADAISQLVISEMSNDAAAANGNENIGHYADRELAYAYLKVNNTNKALEHALAEYNRRPKNIDVNETVAWVYYKKGDYKDAVPYIQQALTTNSKNPTLLCRAGLIYLKNGDAAKAKTLIGEALQSNPAISEALKNESMSALKSL